jgi:hypothetical protein
LLGQGALAAVLVGPTFATPKLQHLRHCMTIEALIFSGITAVVHQTTV